MSALPTGTRTEDGALEMRRKFAESPATLWRHLVDSEHLALWYGPWQGDPQRGAVDVVMLAEHGSPVERVEILHCDPRARHLQVRLGAGATAWQLAWKVEAAGGGSIMAFRMEAVDPQIAGSVGPGWEYYLDRLVAAVNGGDVGNVRFETDYYPALRPYYEELFRG